MRFISKASDLNKRYCSPRSTYSLRTIEPFGLPALMIVITTCYDTWTIATTAYFEKRPALFKDKLADTLTFILLLCNFSKTLRSMMNTCSLGVVNSKKLSSSNLFSTDFGLKVTDQPRIFPVASIWCCTVASNLENASSLCSSKFNPLKISS